MSTPKVRSAAESEPGAAPPFSSPSECSCPPTCTKDRILRAAQNLFYLHGIRAVSVDAIAAEAETTKVTLYRLFESKDALVTECLQDQVSRFWTWWDTTVEPHEGDPRAQIEALFAVLESRICSKGATRGCPIANTAVEVDDAAHPAWHVIREHHDEMAKRLRALCKQMGARQPEALGDALMLLVTGAFSARVTFDSAEHIGAVGEAARALLDSSLGAPGAK